MGEIRTGCVLLRELPPRPTQRSCKISTELKQASLVLDLAAIKGLEDEQQHQLQAFKATWGTINDTINELRQHHLAPVFTQLQQWAAGSAPALQDNPSGQSHELHRSSCHAVRPGSSAAAQKDLWQLPMVTLSVASSTNPSDTYAQLKVALRRKGHPAALITAREAASGMPAVVSSTMRQYMPGVQEAKAADDIPALLAWWQDEWQRAYGAFAATAHTDGVAAAQTPKAAVKARSTTAGDAMDVGHADTAAATPHKTPGKAAAAAATPGRELRTRPAAKTPGKPGAGAGPALAVPVVVLQDADTGDLETLEELVVAFSEACTAGLPVVVVLGVSSSPACLLQLLPNALLRRVSMLSLALPPARQQLVQLYRALLLCGPQPPLLLGPQVATWLLQHFRDADCSASMAERVMQLACAEHFRSQPLSSLAAAAASGRRSKLAEAVAALPQPQVVRCCQALLTHPAAVAAASRSSSAALPMRTITADSKIANAEAECNTVSALEQLRLFVDASSSSSRSHKATSKSKAAAAAGVDCSAAVGVLESTVWAAMQAFGRWRLGVLLLNLLAQFTGLADVDASFQLPSLFAAASQKSFLASKCKGSLSPCGTLLLRLLGNGRSTTRRAGVTTVQELQDGDCLQLLQTMQQLLASSGGPQQQQQQPGVDGSGAAVAASETGTDTGSESDDELQTIPANDSAVASCPTIQQLQQALQAVHALVEATVKQPGAVTDTKAADGDEEQLQSPPKKQKCHPKKQQQKQQQQQQNKGRLLAAFHENFKQLLSPLPEQLEQPVAAPTTRQALLSSAAAEGVRTPGSVHTPIGKAGGKSNPGSDIPTPGGLASALRKHVRFAPDTPAAPNAANGKHAGSLSTHSTPDDVAAVAGHIKTPNKRGVKKEQPRKALFMQATAAAAAAASSGGGNGRKPRKSEKQPEEQGEIAGTSAAALAAVAAAAGGAAGSTQVPAVAGNLRSQRLMQLLSASGAAGSAGSSRGGAGSSTHAAAVAGGSGRRSSTGSKGLLSTPTRAEELDAAVASSPEGALLSPHSSSKGTTRQCSITAAAVNGAATPPTAAAVRGTTRSSSRLSQQSQPQHDVNAAADDDDNLRFDTAVDAFEAMDVQHPQQQHQQQQQQQHQQQHHGDAGKMEAVPPPADGCGSTVASLLSAVIPKLLHDWCSCSSSCGAAPLAAAGAAAFVFNDIALISNMLSAAPRCAVHSALTEPSKFMPGHPVAQGPGWEDTCLAYLLLQQRREDSMAVSDWFGMFCQAQGVKGLTQGSADDDQEGLDAGPKVGRAAKARARAGRKARGYVEARETAAARSTAAAAPAAKANSSKKAGGSSSGSSKDQAVTPKGAAKKRGAAAAAADCGELCHHQQQEGSEVDQQELLAAAARFCQSVAELQHLGVWKGTKRRRLAAVQRMFAPEGPGVVLRYSGSAAAAAIDSLPNHDYDC